MKKIILFVAVVMCFVGCSQNDDIEVQDLYKDVAEAPSTEVDSVELIYNLSMFRIQKEVTNIVKDIEAETGYKYNFKEKTLYNLVLFMKTLPESYIEEKYIETRGRADQKEASYNQNLADFIEATSQEDADYLDVFLDDYVEYGGNSIEYVNSAASSHPKIKYLIAYEAAMIDDHVFNRENGDGRVLVTGDVCADRFWRQVKDEIPHTIIEEVGGTLLMTFPPIGTPVDNLLKFIDAVKLWKMLHEYNMCRAQTA